MKIKLGKKEYVVIEKHELDRFVDTVRVDVQLIDHMLDSMDYCPESMREVYKKMINERVDLAYKRVREFEESL